MSVTTTLTQNAPVTAENVLRLFPDVNAEPTNGHGAQATQDDDLAGYDAAQIQLMEEVCIVLDPDDQPIGSASKKTCKHAPPPPTSARSPSFLPHPATDTGGNPQATS